MASDSRFNSDEFEFVSENNTPRSTSRALCVEITERFLSESRASPRRRRRADSLAWLEIDSEAAWLSKDRTITGSAGCFGVGIRSTPYDLLATHHSCMRRRRVWFGMRVKSVRGRRVTGQVVFPVATHDSMLGRCGCLTHCNSNWRPPAGHHFGRSRRATHRSLGNPPTTGVKPRCIPPGSNTGPPLGKSRSITNRPGDHLLKPYSYVSCVFTAFYFYNCYVYILNICTCEIITSDYMLNISIFFGGDKLFSHSTRKLHGEYFKYSFKLYARAPVQQARIKSFSVNNNAEVIRPVGMDGIKPAVCEFGEFTAGEGRAAKSSGRVTPVASSTFGWFFRFFGFLFTSTKLYLPFHHKSLPAANSPKSENILRVAYVSQFASAKFTNHTDHS
ncbi:hypothetical protein LXL04_038410 [Taraxacum kok-saghyz]